VNAFDEIWENFRRGQTLPGPAQNEASAQSVSLARTALQTPFTPVMILLLGPAMMSVHRLMPTSNTRRLVPFYEQRVFHNFDQIGDSNQAALLERYVLSLTQFGRLSNQIPPPPPPPPPHRKR